MRCRTCKNTETFKHKYTANITETLSFPHRRKVHGITSDTDIDPCLDDDLIPDEYWCVKCLSDDIDMEGYEG